MKLAKFFTSLFLLGVLFSCSKEELVVEDSLINENTDLATDFGRYQGTSLGMYKGVFSTSDSEERGVVEIKIINSQYAKATLEKIDGTVEEYKGIIHGTRALGGMDISFSSDHSSFNFRVDEDGSNPIITDAIDEDKAALIKVVKEDVRGAVVPLTGSFTSAIGGSGTWSIIFNTGDGSGNDTDITTQSIFDTVDYGSATGNEQSGCNTVDDVTTCTIGGAYMSQGVAITWTGSHTYLDISNCSAASGTWTAGVSSGTWTTDNVCTTPGDYIQTAIPITPTAEGTAANCISPNFTLDISEFTDSGLTGDTTCSSTTTVRDVFYSWTATSDALVFRAEQISNEANEDIIIRDSTGAFIACAEGSFFGGTTLSGWSIGDDLIIQIINNIFDESTGFCLAEASVPTVPGNDLCENAFAITCGESVSGNTLLATDTTMNDGPDVFYTFTGTVEGQAVTVSTCGSGFDTRIRIFDSCDGAEITQNDDNAAACGPGGNSQLIFIASLGVEYIILIEGFSDDDLGPFELAVSCVDPAPVCGGTITDFAGASGDVGNCPTGNDFVATSTATGTIGTDADIDNVSVVYIESAFSSPSVNITLTSPEGTSLQLASAADASNGINAVFRDGGDPINVNALETQPFGGTFAAAFDGETVTGDWTLSICDENNTAGSLNSWSIGFCDGDIPPPTFMPVSNDAATRSSIISDERNLRMLKKERLYEKRKRRWIEENEK
ncbi:hypothetical protein GCM10011344_02150 [Dokdonia pacifica]|uniref:Proprotein convertase P-domain-containing protein n=1 Tax=Dokdonia pacifica TaxID=1627892 RepID=A0A238ZCD3_9FLAO|nr:proprotein convertase P-domain-containing protein [Dokdonia pacifica]GGG05294.1 hypothetical protein GCM10011344_02150 [Dokdonia pacifica]SNR80374.1 Proprotein convertase P-domain-containing protein [Dokdonia pacifica]